MPSGRHSRQRVLFAVRAAAASLIVMIAAVAQAGAFMQNPGEGVAIAGGAFTDAVRAYDRAGRLIPVAPWRKFELTSYAEYGITDWLTAVASPSLFVFRQDPPGQSRAATGVAEAGARVRLIGWDNGILSAQTIVRAPLAGAAARPFIDTTRFVQIDARIAWGSSFELLGFRSFSDLQLGFRSNGNFGHEARIDATLGVYALDSELLLLFQSFTALSPGRLGTAKYLSQKVAASAVYWVTPAIGVQIGGVFGLRGINTGAERGGFTAVWVRF